MAIQVCEKFNLANIGVGWTDECHLLYKSVTVEAARAYDEARKDTEDAFARISAMTEFIKDHFVGGKGYDGKDLVDLVKEDIDVLPVKVRSDIFLKMTGQATDPKESATSTDSSSVEAVSA